MTTAHYIHFFPTGPNGCSSYKHVDVLSEEGWWCRVCSHPKPGNYRIGFQVQETRLIPPISNSPFEGVGFARRDFLSLLGEENVERDLILGTLTGPDGRPFEGWVTVRGRHRVVLRGGSKHASWGCCEACGNVSYFGMPPYYLWPAPDPGARILQTHWGTLAIPADLAEPLGIKPKRGFGVSRLTVPDKPRDGFGELTCPPPAGG